MNHNNDTDNANDTTTTTTTATTTTATTRSRKSHVWVGAARQGAAPVHQTSQTRKCPNLNCLNVENLHCPSLMTLIDLNGTNLCPNLNCPNLTSKEIVVQQCPNLN